MTGAHRYGRPGRAGNRHLSLFRDMPAYNPVSLSSCLAVQLNTVPKGVAQIDIATGVECFAPEQAPSAGDSRLKVQRSAAADPSPSPEFRHWQGCERAAVGGGGAGAGGRDGRGRSGKPLERDAASATTLACACPVIRHASLLGHTVAAIACTDACCSCESRSFLAATAPYSSCLDLTQVLPSQTFHHHDLHGEAPDAARPGLPHTRPLRTRYLPVIPTLPCR